MPDRGRAPLADARLAARGFLGGLDGELLARAAEDARALAEGGADALIVENFGDAPFFPRRVPPETVAAMALAAAAARAAAPGLPLGLNVLRNDARAALGLAAALGAAFVRVNVHAGAAVTDQGLLEGRAHATLRARARLAPQVAILADAEVKHAAPLAARPLGETVRELVERALADAVVVTGPATGSPPEPGRVAEARRACGAAPLLVGSGLDASNARALLEHASGAIVGTALKRGGRVDEPVERERVRALRGLFDELARSRGAR